MKTVNSEPFDLLLKALEGNELDKYLFGLGNYSIVDPLVEHPTDLGSIFLLGLNKFIEKSGQGSLDEKLNAVLIKLLVTSNGCWWVTHILYEYLFGFEEGALLFFSAESPVSGTLSEAVVYG